MGSFLRRNILLTIIIFVIIIGVASVFLAVRVKPVRAPEVPASVSTVEPVREVIGASVEGRKIESYTYGNGAKHIIFVGGMHGGYEWNSVLLSYQFKDYLDKNPRAVPDGLSVSVIPSLNPDGVFVVTGKEGRFSIADVSPDQKIQESGRFNSHKVDLNRNLDCNWKSTSMWKAKTVSAGTAPFSEPETQALRNFISEKNPEAVVFWHSQANAVYASECNDGILPVTLDIMDAYAKAAGYPAVKTFDSYKVTGDSEGWLASIHIPAITVELKTHETIEWEKNLAGIKALFAYFGNK